MIKHISLLVLTVALCGCQAAPAVNKIDRALYDEQVTEVPGQIVATNTVLRTNVVVLDPGATNAAGEVISKPKIQQVILPEISYAYAPTTYVTNLVPRATIDGALKTVGLLPFPYAGSIAILLGALYGIYASIRNKKINVALVKGIEAGRDILRDTPEGQALDSKLTAQLERYQIKAGVLPAVNKLLDTHVHD